VVVSFIGGGNRRKPLTLHKSLTDGLYPILLYQVHLNISGNKTRNVSAVMSLKTEQPAIFAGYCPFLVGYF
jgi:hypothetical protein